MNRVDREFANCIKGEHPIYLRHQPSGLYVRDREDIFIILEQQSWKPLLKMPAPGGLLLDLGGFIGDSAWWFLNHQVVSEVISFEPLASNIHVFNQNWYDDVRVRLIPAAVISDQTGSITMHLSKRISCSSVEHFRGRSTIKVSTFEWSDALAFKPSVIKCDVEGSEYTYDWSLLPESVRIVAMELHQFRPAWLIESRRIDKQLLFLGFKHIKAPRHTITFHKNEIAIWAR